MNISSEQLKRLIYELSKNSSQAALKDIYVVFFPKLFRLAIYYVRVEAVAEEIVSDTFLSVWNQRKKLLEIHNFNAYLYQIIRNIAIDHLRSQKNTTENIDTGNVHQYFNPAENPESELISLELMSRLNQAIEQLPERSKLVFKLIREENLKYKEVATMLNIAVKTVEAHMALAVKRLRESLKDGVK